MRAWGRLLAQLVLAITAFPLAKGTWGQIFVINSHVIRSSTLWKNNFYGDNGDLTGEFTGIGYEEILQLGNNAGGKILHENLEKHLLPY